MYILKPFLPVPPGTSWASISSFFDPHGHSLSTTSKIKLLCGIFCTLNGLSQPDAWQFVSFPFNGVLVFSLSGWRTYRSVLRSHGLACSGSGWTRGPFGIVATFGGGTGDSDYTKRVARFWIEVFFYCGVLTGGMAGMSRESSNWLTILPSSS